MIPAELLVLLAVTLILSLRPESLGWAAPFLAIWAASPFIAYWLDKPAASQQEKIADQELKFARGVARRTWRFFETFVGPEDNWLPPDSFQEDPKPVVAHHTSPTNVGLLLLATVAAHDFGFIACSISLERQELTFTTLRKLATFHGHFFSRYYTKTLRAASATIYFDCRKRKSGWSPHRLKQAMIQFPDEKLFDDRNCRAWPTP